MLKTQNFSFSASGKKFVKKRIHEISGSLVIGVIDGSHVKIDKPSNDPDSYLSRKNFPSSYKLFVIMNVKLETYL